MLFLNDLTAALLKEDFYRTYNILEKIRETGDGFEYVEPLIMLMEENPQLDFGMPGPAVHFIESFDSEAYIGLLLESLRRKPVCHTMWMLNRIINDPAFEQGGEYIGVFLEISQRSDVDDTVREQAEEYYRYQTAE